MILDIVGNSEIQKCGLKYVIHSSGRHEKSGTEAPHGTWKGYNNAHKKKDFREGI